MAIDLDAVLRQLSPIHLRSVVESTARQNIWTGSVRSGKTVSSLLRFLIAVAAAPTTGRILIFGKTRETVGRNVFAVLQDTALFGPLAHLVQYNPGAATATILGRVVDVLGANDAKAEPKVRGMTLCLAYGDELTTVPEAFYKQVLYRLSVKGAQLFGTTNPDNPMHWLRKQYLLRQGEISLRTWHSTLDDNPHLDPEYVANAKIENTGMWYKRYIQGLWVMAEGAIYDMWDEDRHVVDVLPTMQRWIALGIDYGTNAPFAALLLGLGHDRNLYLGAEYRHDSKRAQRQLAPVEYSARLRQWLATVPIPGTDLRGVRPDMIIVDPAELQFRVQLTHDGMQTFGADNNVMDGIRTMSTLLATDRLKVHRSCEGFIEEAPGYSWDPDKALEGEDAPVKLDDHSLDAGRYAVHTTAQQWQGAIRPAFALAA